MSTPEPGPARTARRTRAVVLALLAAAAVAGASQLAFLCDDAYIAFRYVSNAHDGAGLVWNKAPFLPVEGYSCFLWVLLLWATWSLTGVEPPAAANVWSIGLGLVLFAVVARAAFRLRHRDGRRPPDSLVFLVLAVVVGNRTFLQWMTSGLETALFNLATVAWTLAAFRPPAERTTRWLCAWSALAAIAALTRPDGLLLVVTTVAATAAVALRAEHGRRQCALGLVPLLATVAHLLWRRGYYGEWLPNTYYAKVAAPWPEAGVRYLYCFVLEHGTWVLVPVVLAWLFVELRRPATATFRVLLTNLPAVAATAATGITVAYYVLRVGGDHFEYRVFSHLVPLSTIALAAIALRLGRSGWPAFAAVAALGVASTFGWLHLALAETHLGPRYTAIAPKLPRWTSPVVRTYDRYQAWLQMQLVCYRCQKHGAVMGMMEAGLPRRQRLAADPDDIPLIDVTTAGYNGWCMPDVAVLDCHGLNDWVTARWPVRAQQAPLSADVAEAVARTADANGDGRATRAELEAAFGIAHLPAADKWGVDLMLVLCAHDDPEALSAAELADFVDYSRNLRFMAHERTVPIEYRDALRPNVTIEGPSGQRVAVVHPRTEPLDAARVRAVEQEWRMRLRSEAGR